MCLEKKKKTKKNQKKKVNFACMKTISPAAIIFILYLI